MQLMCENTRAIFRIVYHFIKSSQWLLLREKNNRCKKVNGQKRNYRGKRRITTLMVIFFTFNLFSFLMMKEKFLVLFQAIKVASGG